MSLSIAALMQLWGNVVLSCMPVLFAAYLYLAESCFEMCVCYQVQFIISVSPLTVIWLKAIAWEWLTKRHVQPNISQVFFVRVCVQGQHLDDYFCAIIILLQKKFLQYWFIQTSDVQENVGGGGWRKELKADLPAKTDAITARALCFSHSFTVSIDGNS